MNNQNEDLCVHLFEMSCVHGVWFLQQTLENVGVPRTLQLFPVGPAVETVTECVSEAASEYHIEREKFGSNCELFLPQMGPLRAIAGPNSDTNTIHAQFK